MEVAVDVGAGNRFAIARTFYPLIEQFPQRPALPQTLATITVGKLPRNRNESIEMNAAIGKGAAAHFQRESK